MSAVPSGRTAKTVTVLEIEAGDLGQLDPDVLVLAQDSPERRCDLALREDSRCDLVEQRLKEVMVRAVDERDVDVTLSERAPWRGGRRSRRRRRRHGGAVSPQRRTTRFEIDCALDSFSVPAVSLMPSTSPSGYSPRSNHTATDAPTNSSSALLTSPGCVQAMLCGPPSIATSCTSSSSAGSRAAVAS